MFSFFALDKKNRSLLADPKTEKKKHSSCVIANKSFCLSSTLELREKETDRRFRMNGKLWQKKMFLFFRTRQEKLLTFAEPEKQKKKQKHKAQVA